jgi:heme exporter protein A
MVVLSVEGACVVGVRISSLTHEFEGREVFGTLDFAYDGACLSVTGPNGSGKSTLLRLLAGLLTPTSGDARLVLDGNELPRESLRQSVGLAAPDLKLYSELSARENLHFILRARRLNDIEGRTSSALREVGLADRADDPVQELSSGLRQRAALAAAIAHDPKVLLLDEPSSNLDELGIATVRALIEKRRQTGLVIIATNDADEAALGEGRLELGGAQ